jgi:hypothetical protein
MHLDADQLVFSVRALAGDTKEKEIQKPFPKPVHIFIRRPNSALSMHPSHFSTAAHPPTHLIRCIGSFVDNDKRIAIPSPYVCNQGAGATLSAFGWPAQQTAAIPLVDRRCTRASSEPWPQYPPLPGPDYPNHPPSWPVVTSPVAWGSDIIYGAGVSV